MLKEMFGFENDGIDLEWCRKMERSNGERGGGEGGEEGEGEGEAQEKAAFTEVFEKKIDGLFDIPGGPTLKVLSSLRDFGVMKLSERHVTVMRLNKLILDILANQIEELSAPRRRTVFLASPLLLLFHFPPPHPLFSFP